MVILEYVYNFFFSRPGVKCVFIKSDKDLIFEKGEEEETAQRRCRELMTEMQRCRRRWRRGAAGHSGARRFVLTPPCSDGSRSLTLTLALWLSPRKHTPLRFTNTH